MSLSKIFFSRHLSPDKTRKSHLDFPDHIYPKAKLKEAGIPEEKWDDLVNLRPLQADNNRKKGDDYPDYYREKVMNEETFKNVTDVSLRTINKKVQEDIKKHYNL